MAYNREITVTFIWGIPGVICHVPCGCWNISCWVFFSILGCGRCPCLGRRRFEVLPGLGGVWGPCQPKPSLLVYWEPWVCSQSLSTRGLGGVFWWGFTGRKPQLITEKLEGACKKTRVDLLVGAVLVLILMKNEDFRAPPRVLLFYHSDLLKWCNSQWIPTRPELSVPATRPAD